MAFISADDTDDDLEWVTLLTNPPLYFNISMNFFSYALNMPPNPLTTEET